MNVSVVGLGKLGSPLAAVLAAGGHDVVGTDLSARSVELVAAGRAPVPEPGLQELMDRSEGRLRATADLAEAVRATEITFVVVPTPSGGDGMFSLHLVEPAVAAIGAALRDHDRWHLVVITSTVMPGSTDGPIRAVLEQASGRTVGDGVSLCYSPEFIALGSVVRDMLHPDLLLVGESDARGGAALEELMQSVVASAPRAVRMANVNAEVAKLAVNTFVTTKISYANMLAELCEALPGGDVDAVTDAIGADSRIGSKYLKGATPYGGPCFPRDNVALAALARQLRTRADIAEATDHINRRQIDRLRDLVLGALPADGTAAVLGLAYKPDTPVIDESPGVALCVALADKGVPVVAHDPVALEGATAVLGERVAAQPSLEHAVAGADVVVLTTPWPAYAGVADLVDRDRPVTIVDCWRQVPDDAVGSGADARVRVVRPGVHTNAIDATGETAHG